MGGEGKGREGKGKGWRGWKEGRVRGEEREEGEKYPYLERPLCMHGCMCTVDTCAYCRRWNTLQEAGSTHVRRLLYIRCQVEEEVGVMEHVRMWLIVWRVLEVDVLYELRVVIV